MTLDNKLGAKICRRGLIGLLGLTIASASMGDQGVNNNYLFLKHQGMDKNNFLLLKDVERFEGYDIKAGFYDDKSVLVIGKFNDYGEVIKEKGFVYLVDTGANGPDKNIDQCQMVPPSDGGALPQVDPTTFNKLLEDVRLGYVAHPERKFKAPPARENNARLDRCKDLIQKNNVIMRNLDEVDGYDVRVTFGKEKNMIWIGNYNNKNKLMMDDGYTFAQDLDKDGTFDKFYVKDAKEGFLQSYEDKTLLTSLYDKASELRNSK